MLGYSIAYYVYLKIPRDLAGLGQHGTGQELAHIFHLLSPGYYIEGNLVTS